LQLVILGFELPAIGLAGVAQFDNVAVLLLEIFNNLSVLVINP